MTHKTKTQGSYLLSLASYAVGFMLLATCLFVNTQFGHSLGRSEWGQNAQAALSISVDIGFAVAALMFGYLLKRRHWPMATVTLIVTVVFGVYTFVSLVGWGASERLAKSKLAAADAIADQRAGEQINAAALKAWQDSLLWLRSTVVKSGERSERRDLLAAMKDTMKAPPVLKPVRDAEAVAADAQSDALASTAAFLGFDVKSDKVLLWLIVALAALGIIGKFFFLAAGSYLWPRKGLPALTNANDNGKALPPIKGPDKKDETPPKVVEAPNTSIAQENISDGAKVASASSSARENISVAGEGQENISAGKAAGQENISTRSTGRFREIQENISAPTPIRPAETSIRLPAPRSIQIVDLTDDPTKLVADFIKRGIVPAPGHRMSATEMWELFNAHHRGHRGDKVLPQVAFGRQMAQQGIKSVSTKGKRGKVYVGYRPAREVPVRAAA
jgi:hypothetical protein